MIKRNKEKKSVLDKISEQPNIIDVMTVFIVILCFIGDIIGEGSGRMAIIYWLLMTPIFFISTLIVEKAQSPDCFKPTHNKQFRFNMALWGSAFLSVIMVLLLWHAGAFYAETVGLVIHIILAHSMFIAGSIFGLRFYLIGLLLFILAWLTINMEGIIAYFIILLIPYYLIMILFKKLSFHLFKRSKTNTHSEIKPIHSK